MAEMVPGPASCSTDSATCLAISSGLSCHRIGSAAVRVHPSLFLMSADYVPVLILFAVSLLNAIGIVVVSHLLNPRRDTPEKLMPYESGMIPLGSTKQRFSVKFYMVAISFIVFDLETILLLPWAAEMRELGWGPFIAVLIFVVVLGLGLVYEWMKGGLEWE